MAPQRQLFSFCIFSVLSFSTITSGYGGTLPDNKPSTQRFAPTYSYKLGKSVPQEAGPERFSLQTLGSTLQSKRMVTNPFHPIHNVSGARPSTPAPISVDKFGAKGIDHTDDTEAFQKAWLEACSSNGAVVLLVPPHRSYFVKQFTFSGAQCKSHITMQIQGTIMAFEDPKTYHFPNKSKQQYWLTFERVQNLVVEGPGTINGNGEKWWQSSCKQNNITRTLVPNCNNDAPTAVTFKKCNNLTVHNLNFEKAQQKHVSFENCTDVKASRLRINTSEASPNTDGIHVTETKNIDISMSRISTGDDCISIMGGSQNVYVANIACGPGHGISIGSLGRGGSEDHVSDVTVFGSRLTGTMYGVRIKTWPGGSGYATNITFQMIQMDNVTNPIIIDQNYCDTATKVINGECKPPPLQKNITAVKVHNVMYQSINGTVSKDGQAIVFNCSSVPGACEKIVLDDVILEKGGAAVCSNVKPTYSRVDLPLNRCPN
ncbi:polygalacturonase-like isoform X1 [Rosa rugosa]|uniref:polygalacturonase-like isoform X1 n=1 Tax=Rosa rugosa TaxID=74645 RepID=UPI002B40CEE6|nr:polygalacturonase-like isoform X1 [Rosa rugosa]